MLFIRFSSVVLLFMSLSIFAQANSGNDVFSSKECVNAKFKFEINHPGKYFGFPKNKLNVSKKGCEIDITFKKIMSKSWTLDICREPVHIKIQDKGSLRVVKRFKGCDGGNYNDDYCEELEAILEVIQDDGLIFAKGKREKLSDEHGQVYCTYLLIKKYLVKGELFSSFKDNIDILKGETLGRPTANCNLKKVEKKSAKTKPNNKNVIEIKEQQKEKKKKTEAEDSF
ncbi:hypothetical protein N9B72_01285 [Bacteriovoracaceae bacterium]|nr:hypothetical protein [Bacteriovoracaceae bacterium]